MIARTITLPDTYWQCLRERGHCWYDDNTGREVLLRTPGSDPFDVYDGALVVDLSATDLDLIESPEGLIVADTNRTTGWTVRVGL